MVASRIGGAGYCYGPDNMRTTIGRAHRILVSGQLPSLLSITGEAAADAVLAACAPPVSRVTVAAKKRAQVLSGQALTMTGNRMSFPTALHDSCRQPVRLQDLDWTDAGLMTTAGDARPPFAADLAARACFSLAAATSRNDPTAPRGPTCALLRSNTTLPVVQADNIWCSAGVWARSISTRPELSYRCLLALRPVAGNRGAMRHSPRFTGR